MQIPATYKNGKIELQGTVPDGIETSQVYVVVSPQGSQSKKEELKAAAAALAKSY